MIWKLNKIQYPLYNLGPGKRIGIWVQGCSLHCRGCINQSVWDREKGKQVPVLAVYEIIKQLGNEYDGLTITGGEPFEQYAQLMAFATLIKRKTNLNILCYTGYSLNKLETRFPDKAFYQCIDILIDGRFEKENPSENSLKGSENQSIYSINNGEAIKIELLNQNKIWSLKCEDNRVYMAGIPKKGEMEVLHTNLSLLGVNSALA
jgi:anaerobic ribonucleoside-triphosphate reductase activating protein